MNKKIAIGAIFSTIIFIFTSSFFIPAGSGGYMNIGDAFIYLCAFIVPKPISIISCAMGASLADLFLGQSILIIPTLNKIDIGFIF